MARLIIEMAATYRMAEVVAASKGTFNTMSREEAQAILNDSRFKAAEAAWEEA